MKCLLPSFLLFLVSPASAGFLSHHKSSYNQKCRDHPVEKCSWVDVSHVSNVTENVCKKVPKKSCVTKTVTELRPELTKKMTEKNIANILQTRLTSRLTSSSVEQQLRGAKLTPSTDPI